MGHLQITGLAFAFFVEAVMLSSSTYTTVRSDVASDATEKNNISRGIKEFVRVVMMSSCSGTILPIFCDFREIQRRYCKLYLHGHKELLAKYPDYL